MVKGLTARTFGTVAPLGRRSHPLDWMKPAMFA
jgi:hypothetical protein